jgi:hypothetical protein
LPNGLRRSTKFLDVTATMVSAVDPPASDHDRRVDEGTATNLRMLGVLIPAGAAMLQVLPTVGPLCPLRRTTGVPCPLCGMTTGVNALARGDVTAAFAANPLAPLLVVLVVSAWLLFLLGRPALPVRTRTLGRSATVVLPGMWLFQLHRYDVI